MATTKFYLDMRAVQGGKPAPLKLSITHKGETVLLPLNIRLLPTQWNKVAEKVINHPQKLFFNSLIKQRKAEVDAEIMRLVGNGEIRKMRSKDIKKHILKASIPETENRNAFATRFKNFAESKKDSTKGVYMHTYSRMSAFDSRLEQRSFEDITKEWLTAFDTFLEKTSPSKNARNIHMRNIRAVFNDAMDDEVTTAYPFRRFKIRPVATPKRSLAVEQLRTLFNAPVEEYAEKYLDMFKLIFFLIGINVIDLCHLEKVVNGRIEYNRSKTNRLYSIKVEPEAMAVIERHRGKGQLLDILDTYKSHKDYLKHINRALQRIGDMRREGRGGKKVFTPLFPTITTYWARHTWATVAASLDIPKETIAAALGHGGNTVTDIYIDFDRRKVDEANRRVIDWVLYGKR